MHTHKAKRNKFDSFHSYEKKSWFELKPPLEVD